MHLISNFSQVYHALRRCTDRGIYLFDDKKFTIKYMTYSEIYHRTSHLSSVLKSFGISRGNEVFICAKTTPAFPALWLALIWLGAIPVPMPPREALIGQNRFRNRLSDIINLFPFYLCNDDEELLIKDLCCKQQSKTTIIPFGRIFSKEEDLNRTHVEPYIPNNNDIAFIQFTSGSISKPKGIFITYRNLIVNVNAMWSRLKVNPVYDRGGSWLPLYHDMGLVGYFLGCMITQTELVLISPLHFAKRPLHFMNLLEQYDVQFCTMPNFAVEWILRRLNKKKHYNFSLCSLKWIGVGAEPIHLYSLNRFERKFQKFGLRDGVISPCYGLAEATLAVTIETPSVGYKVAKYKGKPYPTVGHVIDGIEIKIDYDNKLSRTGLILIKGESIATHALINGRKTKIVDKNGYYNTRDIGYFLKDRLVVLGRSDEMFIINGENFFPHEVENSVRGLYGILRNRVICLGIADVTSPEAKTDIVLLYESRKMKDEDRIALEWEMVRRISCDTGLIPSVILAFPPRGIPATSSGKLRRNQAKECYLRGDYFQKTI